MQPNPARTLAARELIGSYTEYSDAQRAVDFLSDEKFPVERTAIIGSDLRLVEFVVGRLNYGRAALAGAASGAWFGVLIGLFLGAAAGAAFGLAGHAMSRGQRDFLSQRQLAAARYDVVVDSEFANEARTVLARLEQQG